MHTRARSILAKFCFPGVHRFGSTALRPPVMRLSVDATAINSCSSDNIFDEANDTDRSG